MRIRLLQDYNDTPVDSIVEVDEDVGMQLVEEGIAEVYTEETEMEEKKLAIKSIKEVNIIIKKEEEKNMENVIGKMFQHIAGKTITGNAEDSAANGANLVTTGLAALQPLVMQGSIVYSKALKIPVSPSANSMKVPFSIGDMWTKATYMQVSNPAEGVAATATKGQLDAKTLTLVKSAATVAVTDELMEDAAGIDAWIRAELVGKIANVLDYEILKGAGAGMEKINGATNYCVTQSISATPTVAEYIALINKVHPALQAGSEFYMSLTDWNLAVGTFLTSSNLEKQLISFVDKKLFGYPVNVMGCLAAGDVIFGNMSKYAVIETPQMITVSTDVRFLEGEIVYKIATRTAGGIVYKAHATGDSLTVASFSEKS